MSGMTDKGLGEVNCRDVSELVESVGNLVSGMSDWDVLVIGVNTNKLWESVRVLKNLENMLMVPGPGQG